MIAIIDYDMGNVRSIFNAINYIGEDPILTADEELIEEATHIILPGVGSFGTGMAKLKERNLIAILNRQVTEKRKPFLGICLGLQLMAKSSDENGYHEGIGWFDAEVRKFDVSNCDLKIPHVGWNEIKVNIPHPVLDEIEPGSDTFYFVHSYHLCTQIRDHVAATCDYGEEFVAVLINGNIIGTQFHPEKSQDNGIRMLVNFVNWRP